MKRYILFLLAICFVQFLQAITISQWPYICDFETAQETQGWTFYRTDLKAWYGSNAINSPNDWQIGTCTSWKNGTKALFLSSDGKNPIYVGQQRDRYYNSVAYLTLDSLPKGKYLISFEYMAGGRADGHYLWSDLMDFIEDNPYPWRNDNTWDKQEGDHLYMYAEPFWRQCTYECEITESNKPYYLGFGWQMHGSDTTATPLSAIVDHIQITKIDNQFACDVVPQLLTHRREGNDAIFSWVGNASEYEVEYFRTDSVQYLYHATNVTSTEYRVHCDDIAEGTYTFKVRSICGNDTSAWVLIDQILMYDIAKHCIDYLNLDDENVMPQYGWFSCPTCSNGKSDMGWKSKESRHTIHYIPNDYDERTGYKLRTFPQGQPAAVRLGNWNNNAEAEAITYKMTITDDMKVLKMWYALVMQLPGHTHTEQPRYTLEILDSVGNYFDEHCGVVDFTAAANMEGWQTEPSHVAGDTTSVIWKDWTLIGINLREYVGQTIQIRLTTKDCANTEHYGYAYFALGCSRGEMEGIHCGEKPDHFTVEEGFKYRWYRKWDNPRVILGRDRTYKLTNSIDTATYCVDLMQMIDTTCYFTMEASSLAYIPNAKATYRWAPLNCVNYVQMVDSSSTQGVYWTPTGQKVVVTQEDGAETYLWDFGIYGTSTERNPRIAMPDEGDTVHVVLHAMMENELCDDTLGFDMIVPALELKLNVATHFMCPNEPITIDGIYFDKPGFHSDTLKGWTGCDSVNMIAVEYFHSDTIHYYDTICAVNGSIEWKGLTLSESGIYESNIHSMIRNCDSVYNILHLTVWPKLTMNIDYNQQSVCMGTGEINIPYSIEAGSATTYDLIFSDDAQEWGFVNQYEQPIEKNGTIHIDIKDNVWAGIYNADLIVHNIFCDSVSFPMPFSVYYAADEVITQRWDDFLSVRKTAYDLYGGFTDYQWYKDDIIISGETSSQLYLPETKLEMGADYSVEMTRVSDGVRLRSCAYTPTQQPKDITLNVTPTLIDHNSGNTIQVKVSQMADGILYNQSGTEISHYSLNDGINNISIPQAEGIYLLYVTMQDGSQKSQKIIVR